MEFVPRRRSDAGPKRFLRAVGLLVPSVRPAGHASNDELFELAYLITWSHLDPHPRSAARSARLQRSGDPPPPHAA